MSETDDFLRELLPTLLAGEDALHRGDAEPRRQYWSHDDSVTVFGAFLSAKGWEQTSQLFGTIASDFSDLRSATQEIVAADAHGDLAYTVAYEHTSVSIGGKPSTYTLRVTQVYRRESGTWKVVHRHGDGVAEGQALLEATPAIAWVDRD